MHTSIHPSLNESTNRYKNISFEINVDRKKWRAFVAAFLGTVVENYDYALYGYFGAVLSKNFFPVTLDPSVALMRQFLVFALGFLAKPLGAYIFGTIGDKNGRRPALRWSIIGIAFPTALIGCLPDYSEIGWIATAILVMCRIFQGIFISAEGDGVEIFIYETISKRWACLANSMVVLSIRLGYLLAVYMGSIFLAPDFDKWQWAWRVPFFIGGILGVFTVWFRSHLIESFDYILTRSNKNVVKSSLFFQTLANNRKGVFLTFIISGCYGGTSIFFMTFWNNYLHQILNLFTLSESCHRTTYTMITYLICVILGGFVADIYKIKTPFKLATLILLIAIATNGIALFYSNSSPLYVMNITMGALAFFHAPIYITLMKLFSVHERFRCLTMGHALGSIILSSTTPAIATHLWQRFQTPIAPLFYCAFLVCLCFIAFILIKPKEEVVVDYHNKPQLTPKEMEDFKDSEPMIAIDLESPEDATDLLDFYPNTSYKK